MSKAVTCVSSVALAAAIAPATAFAEGDAGVQPEAGAGAEAVQTVLTVYGTDTATNKTEALESYTHEQLESLAKANADRASYLLWASKKAAHQVISTEDYVKVADLLDGVKSWRSGSQLIAASASDSASITLSYDQINADQFFYPHFASLDNASKEDQVKVVPVLSLADATGVLGDDGETAGEVSEAIRDKEPTEQLRLIIGATDATDEGIPLGNTSIKGVGSLTVSYSTANPMKVKANSVSFSAKKAKKSKQTVKKGITVTGNKGKVTFTKKSGSGELSINKSTGNITVKKGNYKKGKTLSIKVKVSDASDGFYQKASKTVTVKVKVAK